MAADFPVADAVQGDYETRLMMDARVRDVLVPWDPVELLFV